MVCPEELRERYREEWITPPEITHLGITVLYQAIACWALLQEKPVTVLDVSLAFQVTERRASDVLHYITHDAGDTVQSETKVIRCPRGRRKAVRVLSVYSPLFFRQKKSGKQQHQAKNSSGRKKRETCESTQHLRTWFVSRRTGEVWSDGTSRTDRDSGK
ncbi:TPA: CaiF/GrlA family transcriptional regulator [Salmonella enterica subsp. salamae serovar 9,46:z4,z24:z39:z42]|nr:CaiF/GrlA family transcriptional regulator [Salmonella enterica subsp. salamae serovar 9,46:z4,z24:z39:z42]